jgi:predicted hotdog family 3-hydroxylacyl-ACP dehydratase
MAIQLDHHTRRAGFVMTTREFLASNPRGSDINQPQITRRERIVDAILGLIRQVGAISG